MSSTDSVLPASRQPMPVSPEVQAELDNRRRRSVDAIERELDERTERLSENIDELVARLRPGRVARDTMAGVRSRVLTSDGWPRPEVLGAIAGAVVGVGVLIWWARRR